MVLAFGLDVHTHAAFWVSKGGTEVRDRDFLGGWSLATAGPHTEPEESFVSGLESLVSIRACYADTRNVEIKVESRAEDTGLESGSEKQVRHRIARLL